MKQKTNSIFSLNTFIAIAIFGMISMFIVFTLPHQVSAQSMQKAAECGTGVRLNTDGECSLEDQEKECKDNTSGNAQTKTQNCNSDSKVEGLIKNIINTLSVLVGAICVIMVIIGGFKFVTSGGDSNATTSARNTVLYALVGLIIVAFAQVIVQFVLQRVA